jgi:hypothetical protein
MAEVYVAPTFVNDNPPAINESNLNTLAKAVESMVVGNGGTGVKEFTEGSILLGDGTDPIDELVGTGAVFATESGNPQMGTLPVSCGGTGATTLDQLKENMGLSLAGVVINEEAPSDTTKLWINPITRTLSFYYNGAWVLVRGVYA